jgi:hypothetical protein
MKTVRELKDFLATLPSDANIDLRIDHSSITGMEFDYEPTSRKLMMRPVFLSHSFVIDRNSFPAPAPAPPLKP